MEPVDLNLSNAPAPTPSPPSAGAFPGKSEVRQTDDGSSASGSRRTQGCEQVIGITRNEEFDVRLLGRGVGRGEREVSFPVK